MEARMMPGDNKAYLMRLAQCAERELALRRRVYPRFVEQGRMKAEFAELEIENMAEIAVHFRSLLDGQTG
jgi:hypothetical protein